MELSHTHDPYTHLQPGARGTVTYTNRHRDFTQIGVQWDHGSVLFMVPEHEDVIRIIGTAPVTCP
ncbi:DUF4314 domain-containing protein [Nonomuraea sp. KM90]|uniref:DUF4314 domain-containing protein n=1 Tax=Nonomuraea sp. KM90 TaxID=3457428 RepID=UPI003FCC85E0